jgi:2,4-diketo-3-deoxy-L-fuconate hydrolase
MKLVRFGAPGNEKPGLIDGEGKLRDLSAHTPDFEGEALASDAIGTLAALDPASLPVVDGAPRLGPCIKRPRHFIAVGLNYVDHAHESGAPIPDEPVLFNKAPSCVNGPSDNVILPPGTTANDWEIELAFVIGRPGSNIAQAQALDHVAGYCICNDVSERDWQIKGTGQWMKGKSAPTFGPLGPWLVTPDEVGDVQQLAMALDVNGVRMQTGNTATMIFSVATLISYISSRMAIETGDLVTTGTPPGIGMARTPPVYLRPGDVMRLEIEKLGVQQQSVRSA